ncbi:2OG-Fe(II) oxygenase family protein [Lacibacterium aquatile]|uniref:2OG-Fe(II) oxygenase family protein n=1 Tax=Lacibacterium aquatile TaxID=1168082 RepID=A0ABW5DPZ7_9PROT
MTSAPDLPVPPVSTSLRFRQLAIGDNLPRLRSHADFPTILDLDSLTGNYVVVLLVDSGESSAEAFRLFDAHSRVGFDAALVTITFSDAETRFKATGEKRFIVQDLGGKAGQMFGAVSLNEDGPARVRALAVLLDPSLRVMASLPIAEAPALARRLSTLPPPVAHSGAFAPPPILIAPRILEPEFCRRLIDYYESNGGTDSGFMVNVDGRTVGKIDHSAKKRADCDIADIGLQNDLKKRIERALVPEIMRVFNFNATRIERYIVACYDDTGGHFGPHRDNTTKGTAHRRFAVTINLNADEYEGGDLFFPEYGPQTWRCPTGGALVFSCSLRHGVTKVTRGKRYATLPFLYDEAAAEIRMANLGYIDN